MDSDLLRQWHLGGELLEVTVRGTARRVFVRCSGEGPALVLLHGFPGSSFEWAAVEPGLAKHHTVVTVDLLGFGASDKPAGHRYSVFEQADLVELICAAMGLMTISMVSYDYGAIVTTELLARGDATGIGLGRCVFLNAGLYANKYRPRPAQRALLVPGLGALLARGFTESVFARSWGEVFSSQHPLSHDAARLHHRALREGDPHGDIHRRLLRYIPERAAHAARFENALATTEVPLSFLWGMRDPVSGQAIAHELRRQRPAADLIEYSEVGHCPHMEIPHRVTADILRRTQEF
ncbi:alpha/beta hydrolase [Nocardia yunnanensis]|uniref:Alpha/beta hydrolase n=1 Tax=Nocardia yunnanensis TaxID=2382165 RepID=A0A386ZJY7_9NOCA|nr:alpha/beta hydrolase [Nocardia yunnanensis]AYF76939.1 alpha/beta hydrolase [Nocardia yunnanensis]